MRTVGYYIFLQTSSWLKSQEDRPANYVRVYMKIESYLLYKEIWFDFSCFVYVNVCAQRKEASSAKCAGRRSNVPQPCPHTCWSTQTPGRTPASTVARGSIRNPTWRNTPTSTQVNKTRERGGNQSWTALMFFKAALFPRRMFPRVIFQQINQEMKLNKCMACLHIWLSCFAQGSVKPSSFVACCIISSEPMKIWIASKSWFGVDFKQKF